MADLLKISVIFILILILLRKKLNVGLVMLIAAAVLFLLYRMPFISVGETCKAAVLNEITIKLILALSFIRIFELILREHDVLTVMMNTVKAIFKNRKVVTVSMPLLIGLMPSVGGAYFSAPMVAETTRDVTMSPEEKGFINYWFRHPWEYILPLYPGVLLASAISKIELYHLITINLAYSVLMLITGFIFAMHGLKGAVKTEERFSKKGLWSFLPIVSVLLLVVIFHMELHYALIAVVLFLLFFYRYNLKSAFTALKHGFSPDVIILILGVMVFKEAMENSGAVKNLSQFFLSEGIPVSPILFLLPFLTGMLTGITVGFVGSTFPLIMSITGNVSMSAVSFAFASGFLGVLLSPVHICLVLTREYFKADIWGMYKMMIPGCIVIFCGAVTVYLLLK
jgi:integral membrane protein (TIGR00529 family)